MQRTYYPPTSKAADFTLTELESGQIYYITGNDKTASLPPDPAPGVNYRFVVESVGGSVGFSVSPATADKINGGTANKDLIGTQGTVVLGDSVEVTYHSSNNWITTQMHGIWDAEA